MFEVDVFNEHDNTFTLTVVSDGDAIDLPGAGVTRVVLKYGSDTDKVIDSAVVGAGVGQPIDWTTSGANGNIIFDVGEQSIPVGLSTGTLIIYDTAHPDGQVWKNKFRMRVEPKQTA